MSNMHHLVGQTLGQYELRELLGVGGMGAVYRGFQATLKREVAVKIMTPDVAQLTDYAERFNREAETAAALEHQNIIPIYDYGTEHGISYVVMRLLTGGTLSDRLREHTRKGQPLPSLGEVAEVLRQLGSALDYAHDRGVIHRDIKPSNVMFDDQGCAYLVDFGIAKLAKAAISLTATGVALGTPTHMAPEQWRAETLTPAADQYALGVMAYAMVTGRMPFDAPTPFALMHKHLHEMPVSPQTIRADVPRTVSEVLSRALAKEPEARYPTCTAFAQAFDRAMRGSTGEATNFFRVPVERPPLPVMPTPEGSAPSRMFRPSETAARPVTRSPVFWVMLVVIVGLVAAVAFMAMGGGGDGDEPALEAVAQATATVEDTGSITVLATLTPDPTATETPESAVVVHTATVISTTAAPPTSTPTDTAVPSATLTREPTATPVPTQTSTTAPTATSVPSPTDTPTHTLTATSAPSPTDTPTHTPTATPAPSETLMPTTTSTSTATATAVPTATHTATHTPTSTDTVTPSPAPTDTVTPSLTPTDTVTPSATPTSSPAAAATESVTSAYGVAVVTAPRASVRANPSPDADWVASVRRDDQLMVLGISPDGEYVQVVVEGQAGWISAELVALEEAALPTVIPATQPTRTPTQTPEPSATLTPSATPTITPTPIYGRVASDGANVRYGPGTDFCVADTLDAGTEVDVRAEVDDEAFDPPHWYQLLLPDDSAVWIWADLLEPLEGADVPDGTDVANAIDRAPVIHEVRIDGACDHYDYIIEWSDVDGDATQIQRPNATETNQYGISGCGGVTTWSWFFCSGERCADEFVIVDRAGNESEIVRTTIDCSAEDG